MVLIQHPTPLGHSSCLRNGSWLVISPPPPMFKESQSLFDQCSTTSFWRYGLANVDCSRGTRVVVNSGLVFGTTRRLRNAHFQSPISSRAVLVPTWTQLRQTLGPRGTHTIHSSHCFANVSYWLYRQSHLYWSQVFPFLPPATNPMRQKWVI